MPMKARPGMNLCPERTAALTQQVDLTKVLRARVLPLDELGQTGHPQHIEVQDFDHRGIKFHHELPVYFRRALVVLESAKECYFSAEVDLSWCRFTRTGNYLSGGRFVQFLNQSA